MKKAATDFGMQDGNFIGSSRDYNKDYIYNGQPEGTYFQLDAEGKETPEQIPDDGKDDGTTVPGGEKEDTTVPSNPSDGENGKPGNTTGNVSKPGQSTGTVKTGDSTLMYPWILLAFTTMGAGVILIFRRKKAK